MKLYQWEKYYNSGIHCICIPLQLEKWTTDDKADTTLLDLLPFLEAIVRTNVPDVRSVVKSYEGTDIPTAFRERMEKVKSVKQASNRKSFFQGLAK